MMHDSQGADAPDVRRVPTVWLDARSAERVRDALRRGERAVEVSLDLNLSMTTLRLPLVAPFPSAAADQEALLSAAAASPRTAWLLRRGTLRPIEHRASRYLKLVPTAEAPTLEIDGIGMHVLDPSGIFRALGATVSRTVRQGDRVLDTCSGLGYTALWALRLGASSVLSYEVDAAVLRLRSLSPWSAGLRDVRLRVRHADVSHAITQLRAGCVDAVVHDPPRISVAGELYSLEFYRGLAQALVPGGRLYHYTGRPFHRWRRRDICRGVGRRLDEAGFDVRWSAQAHGFFGRRRR